MAQLTMHLIGNAHLDPVWLWDYREGLNQGLITCRTILDLMDENPELTFNRGESAVYRHIEQTDRHTYARIRRYVKQGRWDVVGGSVIQPDDNLPTTEALVRQFTSGLSYFAARFGRRVRVAWAADCFGHSAGLPEIFAHAGIQYFAFTRPNSQIIALEKPAFWWVGPGGSRILAYRPLGNWYGTERIELPARLDQTLALAMHQGLVNVGVFYGLGDHGGGPTLRHLSDINAWAKAHPEVRVLHSTMHRFFAALEAEVRQERAGFLPKIAGELNFCLRGCYSTMARFKFLYRQAENSLISAETTAAAVAMATAAKPSPSAASWETLLFNAFHDILPGTSIERGFADQISQLGVCLSDAQQRRFQALNTLAMQVDTHVLGTAEPDSPGGNAALVFNPHPRRFAGLVEIEACMDDRQIPKYQGPTLDELPVRVLDHRKKPLPFQLTATENNFAPHIAWRRRAIVPVVLPPMGWSVLEMAWVEGAPGPVGPIAVAPANAGGAADAGMAHIDNGIYHVATGAGQAGITILRHGQPLLGAGALAAAVFADPGGSWGGSGESPAALKNAPQERWPVTQCRILESGPWRAALWVQLQGPKSSLELTIRLAAGRDAVDIAARVHWQQRSARLRLLFPIDRPCPAVEYEVPGASVVRRLEGEVPGGRWLRVLDGNGCTAQWGLASDALYSFGVNDEYVTATILRATRFAASEPMAADQQPWIPGTDMGEHRFNFLLTGDGPNLPNLAAELESPPLVQLVPPKPGRLPAQGSVLELTPAGLQLLTLKPAEDGQGWILRLRHTGRATVRPRLKLLGTTLVLGPVQANRIAAYRITKVGAKWRASGCDAAEVAAGGQK